VRVLVVGNGGREHAIAWKLLQSAKMKHVYCVPGNGGTATLQGCTNINLMMNDFEGIARFVSVHNISLIVVGPEAPLALGITDYFQEQGLAVFGPTQAGAQIESSKTWAKALMDAANIPTAKAKSFTDPEAACEYVKAEGVPIVIKADGLAAGKGVTVATTLEDAEQAIRDALEGKFGAAGETVLIEEYLDGEEASVLALTDGLTVRPLIAAQDHKRIGDGDTGANTGGMGAYAPAPVVTPALQHRIQTEVLEPAIAELRKQGIDYRGVLYAGLMITPDGNPKVIEFNCRFGDPETQVVLPLLDSPLDELLLACAQQRLETQPPIQWKTGVATCVVAASAGYPESYRKGLPIQGIEDAQMVEGLVFHAGTQLKPQLLTDGGRVLGVTALGETFAASISKAYTAIGKIHFDGIYYRHDIGNRALNPRS
jgi:phosphoribosylamine---glycine ligase